MSYLDGTTSADGGVRVVAICGSLRSRSKTRVALETVLAAASDAGARTELVDLREYDLPAFDADVDSAGDADALSRVVGDADVVVLGTPNYHGSYAGVLKNALDYLGRDEFADKTVGLLEVAGGEFPGSALAHLREVVRTLNAWALPVEVAIPSSHATVTQEGIVDDDVRQRARRLGREAVEHAWVGSIPDNRVATAED